MFSINREQIAEMERAGHVRRLRDHVRDYFCDMNVPDHQEVTNCSCTVIDASSIITQRQRTQYTVTVEIYEDVPA